MRMALCVMGPIGALCVAAEADEKKPPDVGALIAQLGHADFQLRQRASIALLKIGGAAIRLLKNALSSEDLEILARAKRLLDQIPQVVVATPLGTTTVGFWKTRSASARKQMLARHGGSAATELAVTRALIWLRNHQSPSGRWGGDFRAQCKETPCSGVAQLGWVDPGLTGLATLAFLGAGHTHRAGRFKETVKKAIRYLMKVQAPDGLVGGKRGHYMYNHAFCALALTEAYGMTQSPLVKGAAQKAIHWLVKAQNPGMGWR